MTLSSFVDFAFNYDMHLFQKTWESYAPGLPLSFVGLFLAILGWCASYIVLLAVSLLIGGYARAET